MNGDYQAAFLFIVDADEIAAYGCRQKPRWSDDGHTTVDKLERRRWRDNERPSIWEWSRMTKAARFEHAYLFVDQTEQVARANILYRSVDHIPRENNCIAIVEDDQTPRYVDRGWRRIGTFEEIERTTDFLLILIEVFGHPYGQGKTTQIEGTKGETT